MFSRNRGRNGTQYDYFTCIGRHSYRNDCDLPYVSVETVESAVERYYDTIVLGTDTVQSIHENLLKFAKKRNASVERQAKRERKRILDLEAERRKLLQAHLAGAVPLDLLKEEQERITKELANAGAMLANTEVHWEALEENLTAALGLASKFGQAYRRAGFTERRTFNRAVVESIQIDVGGQVKRVVLAQPFRTLLDDGLVNDLICETQNRCPSEDSGSTIVKLVEVTSLALAH